MKISGIVVDPVSRRVERGTLSYNNGVVEGIEWGVGDGDHFIMPGLVDAHVHIESSMLAPRMFGAEIVRHGTVAAMCDPHEMANVLGVEGVVYMADEAAKSDVKFLMGIPSCVPATPFESSGGAISPDDVEFLFKEGKGSFLAEVMNFPGVIAGDKNIIKMIESARRYGKPVDGHAPMLSGEQLRKYVSAGIATDHECSTMDEALEKLSLGMKVLIREGSAAKNYELLQPLIRTHTSMVMLCTDDMHPSSLEKGHINKIIARGVADGHDILDLITVAALNPVRHYGLKAGLLQQGDPADFIVVDNPATMNVLETWIDGRRVYSASQQAERPSAPQLINRFNSSPVNASDLKVKRTAGNYRIITVTDGSLLTGEMIRETGGGEYINPDPSSDIIKIVVKERYNDGPPSVGFVNGMGIRGGAVASTVAHDSHNIIAVGDSDEDIARAINLVTKSKGGLSVVSGKDEHILPLPIGGLMSDGTREEVANRYEDLLRATRAMGCNLKSPFMTMAFLSLLVIPELKLGDKGLFRVSTFSPVGLQF